MRHNPQAPLLWVGDTEDWKTARETNVTLVCPERHCNVELVAVENTHYRHNPRFFRLKSKEAVCDHWPAQSRGGPETPQHDWVKARLASIVRHLGYQATPEHWHTRADVFVHDPAFCLEVQLRPTQFGSRTASRQAKGADVCWFICDGLDSRAATQALFHGRGVRFRILDHKTRRPIEPWASKDGHPELNRRARIQVFGTVGHAPRRGQEPDPTTVRANVAWFTTGPMDGYQFLKEVLAGQRRWYPARSIGHTTGLWVRESDLARYQDFLERSEAHHKEQDRKPVSDGRNELSTAPAEPGNAHANDPVVSTEAIKPPHEIPHSEEPDIFPNLKPSEPLCSETQPSHASSTQPRPSSTQPQRRRWWQLWRRSK